MQRRSFLKTVGGGIGATSLSTIFEPAAMKGVEAATAAVAASTPEEIAQDESYWREIQQAFSISRRMINLNNGYCCPSPRIVTEAVVDYVWQQEEAPSYT